MVGTDMQELAPAAHFCDRCERMPIATDPTLRRPAARPRRAPRRPLRRALLRVRPDRPGRRPPRASGPSAPRSSSPIPTPTRQTVDKLEMARFLDARGIASPRTFAPDELPDDLRFPVLVKMREGMGSNHIHHCQDRRELEFFLGYARVASMVQEVCDGEEFSIDLLCDLDGRCVEAIPRTMIQSKGGEQIKGTTIARSASWSRSAALVSEALPLRGFGTVQCFRTAPGRARGHRRQPARRRRLPAAAGGRRRLTRRWCWRWRPASAVEPRPRQFRAGRDALALLPPDRARGRRATPRGPARPADAAGAPRGVSRPGGAARGHAALGPARPPTIGAACAPLSRYSGLHGDASPPSCSSCRAWSASCCLRPGLRSTASPAAPDLRGGESRCRYAADARAPGVRPDRGLHRGPAGARRTRRTVPPPTTTRPAARSGGRREASPEGAVSALLVG